MSLSVGISNAHLIKEHWANLGLLGQCTVWEYGTGAVIDHFYRNYTTGQDGGLRKPELLREGKRETELEEERQPRDRIDQFGET